MVEYVHNVGFEEGRYRLHIADSVTTDKGVALDGDGQYQMFPPDRLPSGNGLAGGDFQTEFFVDLSNPTNPSRLRSHSHIVGRLSTDDTIEIVWNPAKDTHSGVGRYDIEWDNQPSGSPSGALFVPAVSSSTVSPVLGDGDGIYFHVVAVDRAGNRSEVQHFGPFPIENGGPTVQSTVPSAESFQFERPAQFRITFDDYDIDPATVTPSAFVVEASGGDNTFDDGNEFRILDNDGQIDFDVNSRTATFIPSNPIPEDIYRVTVRDAIADTLGNAMDGDRDGVPGGDYQTTFLFFTPEISGPLDSDTTWRGIIHVTDTVVVPSDTTLTILPGTIIKFDAGASLDVLGNLVAIATPTQRIQLTSLLDDTVGGDGNFDGDQTLPDVNDWKGIRLRRADASAELSYVDIRFAERAIDANTSGVGLTIRSSRIQENGMGIYVYTPFVEIEAENLLVADNQLTGIFIRADSILQLRNSTITGNGFRGSASWHRAGIHQGAARVEIENSIVAFNANGLLHHGDPPITNIANCLFYNPAGGDVVWDNDPGEPDLTENGNRIQNPQFVEALSGDFQLAEGSPAIDRARGNSPATDLLGNARNDDEGIANLGSGNVPYVDLGVYERQVDTVPADLNVDTVRIDRATSVDPGDEITVTWTISNTGQQTLDDLWTDRVYLSTGSSRDRNDILLGELLIDTVLRPGESYSRMIDFVVPESAGPFNLLLTTNEQRAFRESDEINNLGVSQQPLEVAVTQLELNTPQLDVLNHEAWTYFRFDAQPGAPVRFSVASEFARGTAALFVKQGTIPTLSSFDASFSQLFRTDPRVRILEPLAATYYVGVYGQNIRGDTASFTITAELTPLAIHSVSQSRVGTGGPVTLEILGDNFVETDSIKAIGPDGSEITPVSVAYEDPRSTYPTFDFSRQTPGSYDVFITSSTDETVSLIGAFVVDESSDVDFRIDMTLPSRTRPGRRGTIVLEYGNAGTVDLASPLLTLTSDDDIQWRVPGTDQYVTTGSFQIMALSEHGPANILRPGESERLELTIRTPFRAANLPMSLFSLVPNSEEANQPIDWDAIQEASQPFTIADDASMPRTQLVSRPAMETFIDMFRIIQQMPLIHLACLR